MGLKTFLLVAALVSATSAGPAGSRNVECASKCDQNNKFFYELGRKYEYIYEAETKTSLEHTDVNAATIKVSALATLQPMSPCEYVLSLSEVTLHGSEHSETFAAEVTKRPLRFAFHNGRVEHVCPAQEDAPWVVNFKKGILSNMQNSMPNLDEQDTMVVTETDISGICETTYNSKKKGDFTVIERLKKPSKCSHSPQIHQKLSSFGFSFDSLAQGLPIVTSKQKCTQTISKDIIKSVKCEEDHTFQPFEVRASGANTHTVTTLVLKDVKISSSPFLEFFTTRNELLFELPELETKNSAMEAVETILGKLELLTEKGISKEVPALFSDLVSSLRSLTHSQIQTLFGAGQPRIRNFITDALPLVGTPASIGTFVGLILNGEVSEKERDVWISSLAFIKNPSLEMFSALEPLLRDVRENKALLGISSMIHNYCVNDNLCQERQSIKTLIRNFESRLGISCRATSEEEKLNILYAVKAIGNAGHFVNAEYILKRCYLEDNPMEIRVAAIDAWRRVPCDNKDLERNQFLTTFADQAQDNEIRIASYLALMKCPTQELVDTLKDRLISESVNQVASFVWTHLTNLQESAAPEKQWVRHLIGQEFLQKKFTQQSIKLSRNFESSFFLKEQQFGANVESNLIFSGKSFLPRSTMLNFTIDLFGESINLFEVGGRIEGLESYIEKFFGPDGYYPEETIEAIIKNLRQKKTKEETDLENYLTKEEEDVPKGSYYLKLFGSELFYHNFKGIENALPEMTFSNIFEVIMELASKGSVDYTKSYNLINSDFTFPTITGLPVKLTLNGKAIIGLKLNGQFNFEDFSSINIQGIVQPSAAVTMDASMAVDAFVTKSGIKMVSTFHSSTSVSGKAIINHGKLIDLTINTPEEKTEIFDMTEEFFTIDNGVEEKEETPQSPARSGCLSTKPLGMDLCYKYYPSHHSFFRPSALRVSLVKTDSHSGYIFHYSSNLDKTTLLLDMPGSQSDKKWAASMTKELNKYEINIQCPLGSANGKLSYIFNDQEKALETELTLNEKQTYNAKFHLSKSIEKNQFKRANGEILLESLMNNIEEYKFNGKFQYEAEVKFLDVQVELKGMTVPSFTASFNLNRNPEFNSLNLNVMSTPFDLSLSGALGQLSSDSGVTLKGAYRLFSNAPKSFTIQLQYQNQMSDLGITTSASVDIEDLDFKTDVNFDMEDKRFAGRITGKYAHVTWDIEQRYSYEATDQSFTVKSNHRSNIPIIGWEASMDHRTFLFKKGFEMESKGKVWNSNVEKKIIWNFGKYFLFESKINRLGEDRIFLKNEVTKKSASSYAWEAHTKFFNFFEKHVKGSLDYSSASNEFYAKLKLNSKIISKGEITDYDFEWLVDANESQLQCETTLNVNDKNSFLIVTATRSHLKIDSTFIKLFTAEAKIEKGDEGTEFFITSKLEDTDFRVSGGIGPRNLHGIFKYKEQEIKLLARLQNESVELEAQLSPVQRFALKGYYTPGKFDLSFETPFKGWEKQEVTVTYTSFSSDSFQGQARVTFANTNRMTLTYDFKDESEFPIISKNFNCRFTSTFKMIEKIEFSFKHFMSRKAINTKVEGRWNSEILRGNLDAFLKEDGAQLDASLKTPFTEYFSVSFEYKMFQHELSTSLDVAYGPQKSRILLKGNNTDPKDINGSFICSSPFFPEITLNASVKTTDTAKTIEVTGRYNREKFLLVGNCETLFTNEKRTCKLALKLIRGSTNVFSASYSREVEPENGFKTDIKISSSLVSDQSVKGHMEGKLNLPSSAVLTGYIFGPRDFTLRVDINHKITDEKLLTEFNIEQGSWRMGVNFGGNINLETKECSLHGEIKSTWPSLNGFKMMLQHRIQDESKETEIVLNKKEFNFKLYHSILIKDAFNWANILKVNGVYTLRSENILSKGFMKHITKVTWPEKTIDLRVESHHRRRQLNVATMIDTPWTSPIQVTVDHESNGSRRQSKIKIEYRNGKTLLIDSDYEFKENSKFVTLSIFNNDWDMAPLRFEIKLTYGVSDNFDQTLHQLFRRENAWDAFVSATFNSNNNPISLVGKYSEKLKEKKIYVEFDGKRKYSAELAISSQFQSGKFIAILTIPCLSRDSFTGTLTYNYRDHPLHLTLESNLEGKRYYLETLIEKNVFSLKTVGPSVDGSLKMRWHMSEEQKSLMLDFKSPLNLVKDAFLNMSYKVHQSRNFNFESRYDIHKVAFEGKIGNALFDFKSNTTMQGWENLEAKAEYSHLEVLGMISRNNDVVTFSGKGNFEPSQGEGHLRFSLPSSRFKENKIVIEYVNSKSIGKVKIAADVGLEVLEFQALSEPINVSSTRLTMNIQTSWKSFQKATLETIIKRSSIKVSGEVNEYNFESSATVTFDGAKSGMAVLIFTSNIPNWTRFSIEANINLSQMPYKTFLEIKREELIRTYSLFFDISNDNLNVEIKTPIETLEDIKLAGNYKFYDEKFEFSLHYVSQSHNFTLSGHFDYGCCIPNIKVNFVFPNTKLENIALDINGTLTGKDSLNFMLKTGQDSYEVSVSSKLTKSEGAASARITLAEMLDLEVDISYDLVNENKHISVGVERDGILERFSIDGKFTSNEFNFGIETPLTNFRRLLVNGKYQKVGKTYIISGHVVNNDDIYRFEGKAIEMVNGLEIELNFLLNQYESQVIRGLITNEKTSLRYIKGSEEKEILISYYLDNTNVFLKMNSPFEQLSYLAIGARREIRLDGINASVYIHRNSERVELNGLYEMPSPTKLNIKGSLTSRYSKYSLQIIYDLFSQVKKVGLILENGETVTKYLAEAHLAAPQHGFVRVYTPYDGYETNGFEYKFKTLDITDTEIFFTLIQNSKEITFGLQSKYSANDLTFMFKTPFENYEYFGIESKVSFEDRHGKIRLSFGDYKLFVEGNVQLENFVIYIETSAESFKLFKVSSKYELQPLKKSILLELLYNDFKYEVNGCIITSHRSPQINFKFISPLEFMSMFEMTGKLDFTSPSEFLEIGLKVNSIKYFLSFGYQLESLQGSLKLHIVTPIPKWTSAKLNANIDISKATKTLTISFERENIAKTIYLSGKLMDGEIDFDLQTPFEMMNNLRTRGSVSRSKRSIEFEMMNDYYSGGVIASFNSLKITIATPFEKARDVSFEVSKHDRGGGGYLDYKRNNNQVFVNFSVAPKKKGLDIRINSEIPGWELLALTGRIDVEEAIGYITGQRNSDMVQISGSGMLGRMTGSLTITATSSFENYREVKTTLEYNSKRNIFTFESKSNSSNYHILFEFKRGELNIDVFVPNAQQNTEAKGNFKLFKGDLTVSSRFHAIRTFSVHYSLEAQDKLTSKVMIERNGVKHFEMEFEKEGERVHFIVHGRLYGNHSMFHLHSEGWNKLELVFHRNKKEFKITLNGAGALPGSGTVNYEIVNSFRETPRTVYGNIEIDRVSSPRKITLMVHWHTGHEYTFHLAYNADLSNLRRGDFILKIVAPQVNAAPWKNISGEWDIDKSGNLQAVLRMGQGEYNIKGKVGIFDTNLVLSSNALEMKYYLQWKFTRKDSDRDYFMKIGREDKFVMVKCYYKLAEGYISGAFRISRFMAHDFNFDAKWEKHGNTIKGTGTFDYGSLTGTHTLLQFERDPTERSAIFHWETTYEPNSKHLVLRGEYNLSKKMVDIMFKADTETIFALKGSLSNMSPSFSENTIMYFTRFGGDEVTISHDFTNPLAKSLKLTGTFKTLPISCHISWTRNKKLTVFDLKVDMESNFLGKIDAQANFDIRDLDNAKGNFIYSRNNDKHVRLEWSRVKTKTSLVNKIEFDSHFQVLPTARLYFNVDWSKGFEVDGGIHWNNKAIKGNLKITPKNTVATISTPFKKFGNININIDYNLKKPKSKTVSFRYSRGENVIEMAFNLKIVNKKTGSLTLSFTSPFEAFRTLTLDANWKKGTFEAVYKRNDITVNLEGTAEVKADKSSFNLKFTPPNQDPVEVEFSYDLESFVEGSGQKPKNLINVKLHINQQHVNFFVKGYRSPDHVFIEINGGSSFEMIKEFYLKLDSELNLEKREGLLNVRIDEFYFNMRNTFEKRLKGFYLRSKIDSSLTDLPGLIVGFGHEKDSFIVTMGYGENREITFTLKGKEHFRKGFSGTIDIPRRGINGLEYSVDYNFKSKDELEITATVKVEEGKHIKAEIVYNSDGVQSRLRSWVGNHTARVRRSISSESFMVDVGVDDYGFTIEGNYNKESFKKGFKIEGEIFGQKILVAGFLNLNSMTDSEGKLIVKTPFKLLNNVGGEFKIKSSAQGKFIANLDINILYHVSAKADIDFEKGLKGDIYLNFENLIYHINCDFRPNVQGRALSGVISIQTPHPSFEKISIQSTIVTMNFRMFEAHFSLDHPTYPYSFDVMLQLDAPVFSVDITVTSPNNNVFRIVADYSLIKYPFYLKGNSSIYSNSQRIFNSNSELSYKALNDMHIKYEARCGRNYLKGSVNLEIRKDQIKGEASGVLRDYHSFEIKTNIPTHWTKALFEISYANSKERHTLLFNMERVAAFRKYFLDVDSPFLLKGSLDLTVYDEPTPTFKAMIQTPKGFMKFNIFFERFITKEEFNKRLVSEIQIDSPCFVNGLNIYVELLGTSRAGDIKVRIEGEHHYVFYGKFENIARLYNLQINVEAPFLKGKKGSIYVSYDRNENFKLSIESFILDYVNNLYIAMKNGAIIFNCVSPNIPTGMVRIEGKLVMNALPDLNFKLVFAEGSDENTWSAEGNVNLSTSKTSKSVFLKVRTPYESYRKMEFGLNYLEEDTTRLTAFAKPFNLEGEFFYGIRSSVLNTGLELRSGEDEFALTKAEAVVPLNEFGPEFSAYFRGVEYKAMAKAVKTDNGGEFSLYTKNIMPKSVLDVVEMSLRSKAPYEFDVHLGSGGARLLKFGIIFDSSLMAFQNIVKNVKIWPTVNVV